MKLSWLVEPAEGLESHAIAEGLDDVGASSEEAAFAEFERATSQGNLVPIFERIFSDQLTPVTAYRCLVREDDREAPSFLFESVVNGTQQVRSWSMVRRSHARVELERCRCVPDSQGPT